MATAKLKFLGFATAHGDGKYRSAHTSKEGVSAGETFEVEDVEKDGKVVKTGEALAAGYVADFADLGPVSGGKPGPAFALVK